MLTLYGDPCSVFVRKPLLLLREKGVAFKLDPIDLYGYTHIEFEAASPLGKIPALRDDDFTLADSSAICAYIEKLYPYPAFYPHSAQDYASALWWEEYADTVLFKALAACYYQAILMPLYKNKAPDLTAISHCLNVSLPPVARYLEQHIANKIYWVGNEFTIADVSIISMFFNMYHCGYALNAAHYPHLDRYLQLHFKRPSLQQAQQEMAYKLQQLTVS